MPLFQKTVLAKHLRSLDSEKLEARWKLFSAHFHNPEIQQNIRNSKEEQYQEGFVEDLFVKILGYVKNPAPNYNFITEQKNQGDSKKADGAIIINEKVRAVVELKGCNTTDLGKVEAQAFGYKNRQPGCDYVVVSNFEKIRFYVENAVEHLEFSLFELSKKEFELLWLCLSHDSISADLPLKLKSESLSAENEITKELYHDYSVFRRALFNDLVNKNLPRPALPAGRRQAGPDTDKLLLFKKTQKLLDRFLFIFFAEDRLLLPVNLIKNIISEWEKLREMRVEHSLYERFKLYFNDLDTGNPKQDIFAYNGGLFQPDEILDKLQVDDQLLFEHTHKLSTYDFESEVDVNILGHIFENSLNELEEIENQVAQNQAEGEMPVLKTTKRKKDGVFYTPKYITKYIVENTLGKLCAEKKNELEIADEIYVNAKKRNRKRLENLQKYRDWLLQLSICDPACGSGAFLNQALEFLIEEHRYLDELSAKYNNEPLVLSDIENSILENNLYGVDINEESVHIAKLSLWLRTAQRNRKLSDLNQNLKCGNSLIADPEIAGKKAFDWEKEFPQVFAKGGFDVVIGNPPYLSTKGIEEKQKQYFKKEYSTAKGQFDLYGLFIEKSFELLKTDGLFSFITSNTFINNKDFVDLRKFLLEKTTLKSIINLGETVFEDANLDVAILTYQKNLSETKKNKILIAKNATEFASEKYQEIEQINFINEIHNYEFKINCSPQDFKILNKLFDGSLKLSEILNLPRGIEIGSNSEKIKKDESLKPILFGKNISRYEINFDENYIEFEDNPSVFKTLEIFEKPKILIQRIRNLSLKRRIVATYDDNKFLCTNTLRIGNLINEDFDLKFILGILNSKLINYLFLKFFMNKDIYAYQLQIIPIKNNKENQQPFLEKADQMLSLNQELNTVLGKFRSYFSGQYGVQKLSRKLENWHELEFSGFTKELNKSLKKEKRSPLTKKEAFEWLELFEDNQTKVQNLQAQIAATNRAIDQMVYELYGLTEEEVEVVENS